MKNKMTEVEMQTKFIEENMDVLHKYLLWKETILPSQILDDSVDVEAEDVEVVEVTGKTSKSLTETVAKNYGIID